MPGERAGRRRRAASVAHWSSERAGLRDRSYSSSNSAASGCAKRWPGTAPLPRSRRLVLRSWSSSEAVVSPAGPGRLLAQGSGGAGHVRELSFSDAEGCTVCCIAFRSGSGPTVKAGDSSSFHGPRPESSFTLLKSARKEKTAFAGLSCRRRPDRQLACGQPRRCIAVRQAAVRFNRRSTLFADARTRRRPTPHPGATGTRRPRRPSFARGPGCS
jgi:hypothetical protein